MQIVIRIKHGATLARIEELTEKVSSLKYYDFHDVIENVTVDRKLQG